MNSFKDLAGDEWVVRVTTGSLARCRDAGVDILNMFGQQGTASESTSDSDTQQQPLVRLFMEPERTAEVLYAVVYPEATRRGISREQFLERLGGDSLQEARAVFLEGCVNFYPSPAERRACRTVLNEFNRAYQQAMDDLDRQVTPERIRDSLADASGKPSSDSLAS